MLVSGNATVGKNTLEIITITNVTQSELYQHQHQYR